MSGATKDPYGRTPEAQKRASRDHAALADPDVRGARKGRRGQHDDTRTSNQDSPGRVEREMNRGRG